MRIKPVLGVVVAMLSYTLSLPLVAAELSAREIMERVDARDEGDRKVSDMIMTLIDKRGERRVRTIRSYTMNRGSDELSAMYFLSPADVKNSAFLTYDYSDNERDDDQWLYLPALRKSKRIAASDKSGSFMGSDFNYSDMTDRDLDDYDYKLLKEMKVGEQMTWVIESIPRTQEEIDETGYKKSLIFVRQDNFMPIRGIRWVDKGGAIKYLDLPKVAQIDGIWVALTMTMTTKKGKNTLHRTEMTFNNIHFNQEMDESIFTVRQIEKGI